MLLATFSLGNGAAIYRPDFFDVPTDFWLNTYWLLLCGTLIYLLGYGSRALLVLRKDPRSRRIANVYLVACGVRHHGVRRAHHHGLRDADSSLGGWQPGVVVRLPVRRRVRAGVGSLVANQDEVVHPSESLRRDAMSDHTYRVIEVVGSSPDSIDAAIRNAISRAAETMRGLDWFEVQSVRGNLENGAIGYFQVTLKVGFRLEDSG